MLPKVQISFRLVNAHDQFVIHMQGPKSQVYQANDLIAKWTQNMPPELQKIRCV